MTKRVQIFAKQLDWNQISWFRIVTKWQGWNGRLDPNLSRNCWIEIRNGIFFSHKMAGLKREIWFEFVTKWQYWRRNQIWICHKMAGSKWEMGLYFVTKRLDWNQKCDLNSSGLKWEIGLRIVTKWQEFKREIEFKFVTKRLDGNEKRGFGIAQMPGQGNRLDLRIHRPYIVQEV